MTPSAICYKPLIKTGHIAENITACPTKCNDSKSEERAKATGESECECGEDLLLCSFWARRTNYIVDMHVINMIDAKSYCKRPPEKVLGDR
jgi:hypothetical protein